MMPRRTVIHFSPQRRPAPSVAQEFVAEASYSLKELHRAEDVFLCVSRAYPLLILVDAARPAEEALELCASLKQETFSAVVPVVAYVSANDPDTIARALESGADEVLSPVFSARESGLRLRMVVKRAERDVSVHPTTRLPGTVQIEKDIVSRLESGARFAVCYADLDHFKEFNDQYGYNHGDEVILIVSRILRDVVRAHSPRGFVGHIGGDDFIFNVPFEDLKACCNGILEIFAELIPLQYTAEDQERGYFYGKDRRGQEYQVPLMTLSIGVVTNQHRELRHPAQVSELAAEMKRYAKSVPGSVCVVDRRRGELPTS